MSTPAAEELAASFFFRMTGYTRSPEYEGSREMSLCREMAEFTLGRYPWGGDPEEQLHRNRLRHAYFEGWWLGKREGQP